jgi:hypothetical protein
MQAMVAQPELDDRAFKELEEAGSRKGSRRRLVLTEPLRARLRLTIQRYANLHAFESTYSPEAIDRRAAVAELPTGLLKSLKPLDLRQIVYGEETALAVCVDGIDSGDREADKLLASVPGAIEVVEELLMRARRCSNAVDGRFTRKHPRRNVHNKLFAREIAEIFRLAGGKPGFGNRSDGPFARFLKKLWEFLPLGTQPMSRSGLVEHCRAALHDEEQREIKRRVLHALRQGGKNKDGLCASFSRDFKESAVDSALVALAACGEIVSSTERVGRQRVVTWSLHKTPEMIEREMQHDGALDAAISAAMRETGSFKD